MGHAMCGALVADDILIDLIYAALLGESSWQKFLDCLANSAPGGKTILLMHDNNKENGYIPMASGITSDVLEKYNKYYTRINPFMRSAFLRPVGVGLTDDDLIDRKIRENTEFFNDFLKPNEMPSRVALTIDRAQGYQFVVASLGEKFDERHKRNIADQLTRLHPHLKRAARYYRNELDTKAVNELGASISDAADIGLLVVTDGGRMQALSRTGEIILQQTSAISVSPLGTVSLREAQAQSILSDMLMRTYRGPKLANCISHGTKLTLICMQGDKVSLLFQGPTIIILMEIQGKKNVLDVQLFADMYGLSKAEVRALKGIIEGKSPKRIARDATLSHETIRTQLKSLYAKTGTSGQTDLLRLINFGRSSVDNSTINLKFSDEMAGSL